MNMLTLRGVFEGDFDDLSIFTIVQEGPATLEPRTKKMLTLRGVFEDGSSNPSRITPVQK